MDLHNFTKKVDDNLYMTYLVSSKNTNTSFLDFNSSIKQFEEYISTVNLGINERVRNLMFHIRFSISSEILQSKPRKVIRKAFS